MLYATEQNMPDTGTLQITVQNRNNIPIENAAVSISYTGNSSEILERVYTNSNGKTDILTLRTPPLEYSLEPYADQMPYAEFNLRITAPGYAPAVISGTEVLSRELSLQTVYLSPMGTENNPDIVSIPAHTLFGNYPPKIAETEIKPIRSTGEIVLDQVVIPEYIIVHNGTPRDSSAADYYVRYKDYIKNVASSEIYSTWPLQTLIANILAIQSFTLNRIYTEWYRNKGYRFTITSSTAFDQKWIPGRNTFQQIDQVVDDIFQNYLSRPEIRQPILTQYCDGRQVQCPQWLSQWGSAALGENGLSAIEILRSYYGNSIFINSAEEVSGIPESYPGYPLSEGSSGNDVRKIQEQLNTISNNYPLIPKLDPDGIFGPYTKKAVQTFQSVFGLQQDGIVGPRTWYRIQDIYVAVTRLAENN